MSAEWAAALAWACRLGLSPQAFWALSVAEWRALRGAFAAPEGMDRARLKALAARYPDRKGQ